MMQEEVLMSSILWAAAGKKKRLQEMIGRYAIFTPCAVPVVKWQRAGCNAGSDARDLSALSDGGGYE
jgi:hypothetical protein